MGEITKVRASNGYGVVSTFSGCGGSCLGFEMDGYQILRAHEFVPAAIDTYLANHPGVPVDNRDLRTVTAEEILTASGLDVGELDVLEGSPPCSSFSSAGTGPKTWGKVKAYSDVAQRTDDLFFEFARLLDGIQPKTFVAENVSGLVKGSAKGYFIEILGRLKAAGYRVEARLLDAAWLGVPQSRQRIIFVGVRNDLIDTSGEMIEPAFPGPLPYRYSVRDACPWIAKIDFDNSGSWNHSQHPVGLDRPIETLTVTNLTQGAFKVEGPPVEPEAWLRLCAAEEWPRPALGEQSKKYISITRADPDRPSPTILASVTAGITHPSEPRRFSIAEVKLLCGFPDDFELTGSFAQQWERMGRSVPPLMMRAVAATIRTEILDRVAS